MQLERERDKNFLGSLDPEAESITLGSNQELLPSGIYKKWLMDRIFAKYKFCAPALEIGCGTGEFLDTLSERGLSGLGIEMSEISLATARQRLIGSNFDLEKIDLFEFKGGPFKSVFIFEVLEHIDDDVTAMQRLFGLLDPGGLLVLSVPAKQALYTEEDAFQGHVRRYERLDLRDKLHNAGFIVRDFWCYNPIPYVRKYLGSGSAKHSKKEMSQIDRTKESAYEMHPETEKWVKRLYPIYSRLKFLLHIQDLFLRTDFGAHYLVVVEKPPLSS